ncbi:MAG: hypothetical protein SOS24_04675 [Clostridia bacterium]|nr:hypothetical protein [Clostridia bacterium]
MKRLISVITAFSVSVGMVMPVVLADEAVSVYDAAELASAATKGGIYKIADGVEQIDCSETSIQPKTSFTLDLNGAEILVNSNGIDLQNGSTVSLANGKITGTGTYTIKAMPSKEAASITLDHITTSGAKNGIATANTYATVSITDSDISGTAAGVAGTMGNYTITDSKLGAVTLANDSTLTMLGSTVESNGNGITANNAASATIVNSTITGNTNNFGIYWASSGDLDITATSVTVDANGKGAVHGNNSTGIINIENCTIVNSCETAAKAYLFTSNSGDAAKITVNGGTYTGINALNASSSTSLVINSGLFSADPSKYVAQGRAAIKNAEGWYEVVDAGSIPTPSPTPDPDETPDPNATPAPTATPTAVPTQAPAPAKAEKPEELTTVTTAEELSKALAAKATGIRLGADIDFVDKGIKTTCALYLDLNGHKLTSAASAVIEVAHSMTLADTADEKGAVINTNTATSYGLKCAASNTYVVVEGAEVDAMSQAILLNGANTYLELDNAVVNGGTHAINMARDTLIVNSAVINSNADYSGYALYTSGGKAVINGGSFNYNGTMSSVVVSGSADVTINGGSFTNANLKRGALNNAKGFSGKLTINGGVFENTYDGTGYSILDSDEGTTAVKPEIIINGGEFKDAIGFSKPANTTTVIKAAGGTFSFDPTPYAAEGYKVKENNGVYTVEAEEPSGDKPTADAIYANGVLKIGFTNLNETEGTVFVAQYDENGVLIGISAITLNDYIEESIEQKSDDMRIFVWNKNQKPLFNVFRPKRGEM